MSDRSKRKLIEVALPLEAINVASAIEKNIRHGHPSTLHLWWARRPLAACRAVLFASLVDDPSSDPERYPTPKAVEDERTRLFGIIERLVVWENSTNEAVLEEARLEIRRSTGGNPPPVLDPFCGGGSIPLEAQRLGLTAYASDLNPVAVLITKALIEIPPKFANQAPVHPDARRGIGGTGAWRGAAGLAEDVRRYGAWMRDEAARRIGRLYPMVRLPKEKGGGEATVIAWLWARTVTCPNPACEAQMPLLSSFVLSAKKGQEAFLNPVVHDRRVSFEISRRAPGIGTDPKKGYKRGMSGVFECAVCSTVTTRDYVASEGVSGRLGAALTAIVIERNGVRTYLPADEATVPVEIPSVDTSALDVSFPENPRDLWCRNFGLTTPRHLFTARQLVSLTTLSGLIGEARQRVLADALAAGQTNDELALSSGGLGAKAYADAIATYLAFCVDKSSLTNTTLATWQSNPPRLTQAYGRQALPMTWDYAEANPLSDAGGGFGLTSIAVGEVLDRLEVGPPGEVRQADAAEAADRSGTYLVSTDPPYYDNIGYSDLSDYFYVWLRRSLASTHPDLFGTVLTPKATELVAAAYRFDGDSARADRHFEKGLAGAFTQIGRLADTRYPVTVFYAFKQAESGEDNIDGSLASTGWEKMLDGLLEAGFAIDGTWPMRTELVANLKKGIGALASSIVLVCRPRAADAGITTRKDFVGSLKREMPEALRTLQHGNIAPVDLAQSSIGPGMAIFSRYAKVLEPDGSAMRVRTALALINQVLDEILAEQEGEFDADTRWAIAWYEQFGLGESAYGTAETLSKAKNSSVAGLVEAGIVAASRGRVRLLARAEYSTDWDPAKDRRIPVWEAAQRLVHALLTDGEASAGDLLARLGGLGDTARDLAYRMYHVAERKGWTEEARAYNALVVAWTDLARGAESARAAQPAQTSLGLE